MKIKRLLSAFLAVLLTISCVGVITMAADAKPEYLVNTLYKLKNDKELTVAYFGGSVTAGTGLQGADVEMYSWRGLTRDWLKDNFPQAKITELNAAIGGTGSLYGVFRADDMLIKEKAPDLTFIEFAINDHYDGIYNIKENYVYIETIVRKIYASNPNADIVFVITGANYQLQDDAKSDIPFFGYPYQLIGEKYDIPVLFAGRELIRKIYAENNNVYPSQTSEIWYKYFTDIVHPTKDGYASYGETVIRFLEENLITEYTPVAADVIDKTKAQDYEITFSEKNKKNDGTKTVEKMMDADIVGVDEIGNSKYMGKFSSSQQGAHPAITSSKNNGAVASFEFNAANIALWTYTFGDQAPGTFVYYSIDGGKQQMIDAVYGGSSNHKIYTLATGLESGKTHTIRFDHSETASASFRIFYFMLWDVIDGEEAKVTAVPYYDFSGDYSVKIDGLDFADFDPNKKSYEIPVGEDGAYPTISFAAKDYYGYTIKQANSKSNIATLSIDNVEKYTFKFVKEAKAENVKVSFDTNGAAAIEAQTVKTGKTAVMPVAPTKDGYVFDGWYKDATFSERFFFGTTAVSYNTTVYARWLDADEVSKRITLTIDKTEADVFGDAATNDVAPIIRNGRTMLPARFVAENLGATVEWDNDERKVTIKNDETEILIYIDSDTAKVNGKDVKLDSPAFIENSRTYTPVRFIVENLGASIEWKEDERQVVIIK